MFAVANPPIPSALLFYLFFLIALLLTPIDCKCSTSLRRDVAPWFNVCKLCWEGEGVGGTWKIVMEDYFRVLRTFADSVRVVVVVKLFWNSIKTVWCRIWCFFLLYFGSPWWRVFSSERLGRSAVMCFAASNLLIESGMWNSLEKGVTGRGPTEKNGCLLLDAGKDHWNELGSLCVRVLRGILESQ